jgi:hypothetical protein
MSTRSLRVAPAVALAKAVSALHAVAREVRRGTTVRRCGGSLRAGHVTKCHAGSRSWQAQTATCRGGKVEICCRREEGVVGTAMLKRVTLKCAFSCGHGSSPAE